MSFSDKTKTEAKKNAGYKCCWCQNSMDIEVHHIIPEEEGGENTIDNAVALCPNCHKAFGHDPTKRKAMREHRTWWYEVNEKMYSRNISNPEQLSEIHVLLQKMHEKQNTTLQKQGKFDDDLENLKDQLKIIANQAIDNMTPVTSDITVSSVLSSAVSSFSEIALKEGEMFCTRCHNPIDIRNDFCPYCNYYTG